MHLSNHYSSPFSCFNLSNMSSSRQNSSFARTCNLLSRYVKEKGSLEIGGKVESLQVLLKPGSVDHTSTCSTMNLLTNMEKSAQVVTEQRPVVDISKDSTTAAEYKTAPLTIFYSGKLLVFDDCPADKANELLAFAKNVSPEMSLGILSNTLQEKSNHSNSVGISSSTCKERTNSSTSVGIAPSSRSVRVPLQPNAANDSDLPIARRSSLHRFLEKRKDRAAARGPYQVPELPALSSNGDEQLELRL